MKQLRVPGPRLHGELAHIPVDQVVPRQHPEHGVHHLLRGVGPVPRHTLLINAMNQGMNAVADMAGRADATSVPRQQMPFYS